MAYQGKKIVALVPMRHSSERVPGKNYRMMDDKPLYAHIVDTLLACEEIDQILVDTDSPDVMAGLQGKDVRIVVVERPAELRDGEIPMNTILLHDTGLIEADFYLQTHSTNPLLKAETISKAIHTFVAQYPEKTSLFSVTGLQTRLYWEDGTAINHNPKELLRTQDLPPVYEENSCIYLFERETLVKHGHRISPKAMMFPIAAEEAMDIDVELDFLMVELMLKLKREKNLY